MANIADATLKRMYPERVAIHGSDGHLHTAQWVNSSPTDLVCTTCTETCGNSARTVLTAEYYKVAARENPQGPSDATTWIERGGSWIGKLVYARSATRGVNPPIRRSDTGFRIARSRSDSNFQFGNQLGEFGRASPAGSGNSIEPGFITLYTRGDPWKQAWKMYGDGRIEVEGDDVLVMKGSQAILTYAHRCFDDFILRLDYQTTDATDNSGVYFAIPTLGMTVDGITKEALEVQILDSGANVNGTGAIWGKKPASRPPLTNSPGIWNSLELNVKGTRCEVSINGTQVNTYTAPTGRCGYLGLQSWRSSRGADSTVRFRNIRIASVADNRAGRPAHQETDYKSIVTDASTRLEPLGAIRNWVDAPKDSASQRLEPSSSDRIENLARLPRAQPARQSVTLVTPRFRHGTLRKYLDIRILSSMGKGR